MKHVFVLDPNAFHNQQWKMDGILDHIGQFFRTQDKPDFSIQFTRYRRDAIYIIHEEAEKAKEDDIIRVYAIGGEEILFDCVNAIAHYENMEIATVPQGEASDFLKIFGEDKTELFKDIPSVINAGSIPTDLIKCGTNFALNSCYIGLNSASAARLYKLKSNLNKGSFIIFSKLSSFFNYLLTAFDKKIAAQNYNIIIDDADYSGNYSLIHIANSPYHAGRKTGASSAMPDDGLLDVALIKSASPLKTIWSLRRYSVGKQPSNCVFVKAKKILIKSDRHMWIQLDNEYFQDTNVNLNVVPMALQMVAIDNLSYPAVPIPAQ